MEALLGRLEEAQIQSLTVFARPEIGLRAVLVIDDTTLGPAAGGMRTQRYASTGDALDDAARLARAMTLKCAIAGLDAGGGKLVIMESDALDRRAAFRFLGERVEELGGSFLTAGDLGTTAADLQEMASTTRWVRTDEGDLVDSVARGLVGCVHACCDVAERPRQGLRAAIQGCGAIGAAVAHALATAGIDLVVADIDSAAAAAVAAETGAEIADPATILQTEADVLVPCATGGVITVDVAATLRAWAICGAANNLLSEPAAAAQLHQRDILLVPDIIASAGAVIHGVCDFGNHGDPIPLIDRLADTARSVLETSRRRDMPTPDVALEMAHRRLGRTAA